MQINQNRHHQPQEIACQQVLQEDNSVFSIQWTDLPPGIAEGVTPGFVMARYLDSISRATWHLIQPISTSDGVSFNLFKRLPLLRFLPPAVYHDGNDDGLALRICGGLLVQPQQCERGELLLLTSPLADGGLRITLRLSDYCPLLLGSARPSFFRRWLYRLTQATIHRLVTIRFLARLYRELAGPATRVLTIKVQVKNGQRT